MWCAQVRYRTQQFVDMTNLYDLIGATTPNGTWTYEGGATSPPPPATYDGDIDFTGFPYGTRTYAYTVQNLCGGLVRKTIQVDYQEQTDYPNDTCVTALQIGSPFYTGQFSVIGTCPGVAAPTKDITVPYPNSWGGDALGDAWFRFTVQNADSLNITVSGNNFNNGVQQPKIALYEGNCDNLQEIQAQDSANQLVTMSLFYTPTVTEINYYLRVSYAEEGQFQLTINKNNI